MRISRLLHVDIISALLVGVMIPGCAARPVAPIGTPAGDSLPVARAVENELDWSGRPMLPLLLALPLEPILEKERFDRKFGYAECPSAGVWADGPPGMPFENDDKAAVAARTWIIQHFGPLPREITLKVTCILHSSSGRETPEFESDVGYTICLEES